MHAALGRTNRMIGEQLGISERTVRNHLRTINRKLSSPDRTHAVVIAISNGWIAIPIEPEPDQAVAGVKGPIARETTPNRT
jgi:predicted transcriptional regulator